MESFLQPYDWAEVGNRTSRPLNVTYDGRTWILPPFPATVNMPQVVAQKAIEQNILMGSENPYGGGYDFESLVFVRGWLTPAGAPMPETACEQSRAIERFDPALLDEDRGHHRDVMHFGRVSPDRRPPTAGDDTARKGATSHFTGGGED